MFDLSAQEGDLSTENLSNLCARCLEGRDTIGEHVASSRECLGDVDQGEQELSL